MVYYWKDIQNFEEEVRLILYNINLFEKHNQLKKKVLKQNSFIVLFYFCIPNFVEIYSLGKKLKIYDIFPPLFMAPSYAGVYFPAGLHFSLMSRSKLAKKNIKSIKFGAFIRDVIRILWGSLSCAHFMRLIFIFLIFLFFIFVFLICSHLREPYSLWS